jgi:hypothetical protein
MRLSGIICCLLVLSCRGEPANPSASQNIISVNEGFTLAVGETVAIRGADLTIKLNRVTEDSRCPTDVVCVWAGNAQLEFTARHANRDIVLHLNTGQGAKEFTVGSHRIRLAELNPAPVSTQPIPPESYRARLVVMKA